MKESEENILIVVGASFVGVSIGECGRTPTGIAFAKAGPLTWLSDGTGGEEHPPESIRGRRQGGRHNFDHQPSTPSLLLFDDCKGQFRAL